jgi:hypothetical protein
MLAHKFRFSLGGLGLSKVLGALLPHWRMRRLVREFVKHVEDLDHEILSAKVAVSESIESLNGSSAKGGTSNNAINESAGRASTIDVHAAGGLSLIQRACDLCRDWEVACYQDQSADLGVAKSPHLQDTTSGDRCVVVEVAEDKSKDRSLGPEYVPLLKSTEVLSSAIPISATSRISATGNESAGKLFDDVVGKIQMLRELRRARALILLKLEMHRRMLGSVVIQEL